MGAGRGSQIALRRRRQGRLQVDYKATVPDERSGPRVGLDNERRARPTSASVATGSPSWAPGATRSACTSRPSSREPNVAAVDVSARTSAPTSSCWTRSCGSLHAAFKVNVGRFKYNLSRENLEACEDPLTLDRSLFIRRRYVGTRDNGVAIWGNLLNDRFQYRADAMEGRPAASGAVDAGFELPLLVPAIPTLLLDPESGYGYRGTYLGREEGVHDRRRLPDGERRRPTRTP